MPAKLPKKYLQKLQSISSTPTPTTPSEPEFTTFEDFFEEAIRLEQQGERYDSGTRSLRYYQQSLEFYQKAHSLNPTDIDCLYNWARVHYVLSGFQDPQPSLIERKEFVETAIRMFKECLGMDESNTDVLFNLAMALKDYVEIMDEFGNGVDGKSVLNEAGMLLERVFEIQRSLYESSNSANSTDNSQDTELNMNANVDLDGQESVNSGSFEYATEISPLTLETLIETLIACSSLSIELGTLTSETAYFNNAGQKLELAKSMFQSLSPLPQIPSPDHLQKLSGAEKIHLQDTIATRLSLQKDLCFAIVEYHLALKQFDQAIVVLNEIADYLQTTWIPLFASKLTSLLDEIICEKADTLLFIADSLPDTQSSQAKTYLAECTNLYTSIFSRPGLATQRQAKLAISLGDVHLVRTKYYQETKHVSIMAKNAVVYYNSYLNRIASISVTEGEVRKVLARVVQALWVRWECEQLQELLTEAEKVLLQWKSKVVANGGVNNFESALELFQRDVDEVWSQSLKETQVEFVKRVVLAM